MKKHATFFLLSLMITTIAAAQGGKIKITGTFDNKNWDGKRNGQKADGNLARRQRFVKQ